jgi:hypothetical protein
MEEPWLRGPIAGVSPLLSPVLASFQQAREDLARATDGLTAERLWTAPPNCGPVGFHLRHIGGTVDRLITYLKGAELTPAQMEELKAEKTPGAGREELLAGLDRAFAQAEAVIRALDPATLAQPRTVGRKRLPTTVIGLLTHIAEHTQRHVGEVIISARFV